MDYKNHLAQKMKDSDLKKEYEALEPRGKKDNRGEAVAQLWATTQEYAATKGTSRRTVQEWIKTGRIEPQIRATGKKRGSKGSGHEVLIRDAAGIEKVLRLRVEAKPKPRNKNKAVDDLKKKLAGAYGEISELKKEREEREALLSEKGKQLKEARAAAKELKKHYDKRLKGLESALEEARENADESIQRTHEKELDDWRKKLVVMSNAVKARQAEVDKLKETIFKLKDQVMAKEGDAKASVMARMDIEDQLTKERERYSVLSSKMGKEVEKLYQLGEGERKGVTIDPLGNTLKEIAEGLKKLMVQLPQQKTS